MGFSEDRMMADPMMADPLGLSTRALWLSTTAQNPISNPLPVLMRRRRCIIKLVTFTGIVLWVLAINLHRLPPVRQVVALCTSLPCN